VNGGSTSSPVVAFILGAITVYVVFWVFRKARQISSKTAHLMVDTGALLLDVRTIKEFEAGHLPNAKNVPLPMVTSNPSAVGDTKRPIVVYCQSGTRSALASMVLRRAGFAHVVDLGPMSRW
jgi:phage shock protein E